MEQPEQLQPLGGYMDGMLVIKQDKNTTRLGAKFSWQELKELKKVVQELISSK